MKKNFRYLYLLFALCSSIVFTNCSKDKNGDLLLFSIEDDKKMGEQTAHQIDSIYAGRILDRTQYAAAYNYLESAKQDILNSGKINYKDEFTWEIKIIKSDTLNAFCTPGGHIYFYTGLIKYLDSGDHLVGVLGHEMAHADKRHTSKDLQKRYGVGVLLGILTGGNSGVLTEIAASLALLKYGREAESEADASSVEYLAATEFACNGAAGFFQKMIDAGQSADVPVFLSTHPADTERVDAINAKANEVGCDTTPSPNTDFETMKTTLP